MHIRGDSMAADEPPPTKEQLLARLENLHGQAVELRDRAAARGSGPGLRWGVIFLMIGLPIGVGGGITFAVSSILWGVLAGVAALVLVLAILLRNTPASLQPGTRAWESKLTAELLDRIIASRLAERDAIQDPEGRARLDREIAFLRGQRGQHALVWASEDPSPGKGEISYKPYDGS